MKITALMNHERKPDARINIGTNYENVRLAITRCELPIRAALAQVFVTHRCAVFYIQLAHNHHSLSGLRQKKKLTGEKAATDWCSAIELLKLALQTGIEPATTSVSSEVSVACATGQAIVLAYTSYSRRRGMADESLELLPRGALQFGTTPPPAK